MRFHATLACMIALLLGCPALAGPDVEEGSRDAGGTPPTSKQAKGNGNVLTISGALSVGYVQGDIVDMFLVYVPNPATFAAKTEWATTPWDTELWLFRVTFDALGNPLYAYAVAGNDDDPSGGTLSSRVFFPTGTTQYPPGVYAVAITPYKVRPWGLSPQGVPGEIFSASAGSNGLYAPSGFGLERPLSYWDAVSAPVTPGPYKMQMFGTILIPPGTGQAVCGDIFAGDCFAAHPTTKGCTDPDCCRIVCTADPLCCTASWDSLCAFIAQQNCPQCSVPVNTCPADLNGDGVVNGADLGILLTAWGICP